MGRLRLSTTDKPSDQKSSIDPEDVFGSETEVTEETAAEETQAAEETSAEETIAEETVIAETTGETIAGTEQPDPNGGWLEQLPLDNVWFFAAIALAVVLLVAMIAAAVRKKKKKAAKTRRRRRPDMETTAHEEAAPAVAATAATAASAPVAAAASPISVGVHHAIGAREDQQDSYGVSNPALYAQQGVMAIVADGMGGLSNGKAVSSALVRTFLDGFGQLSFYNQAQDVLLDLAIRANAHINQMLRGAERSGSTLVSALIRNGYLHFLTVGDSRIYLYRGGALLQLNREHIYQEELAVKAVNQAVAISQVRGDRQAHSLTSYFGIGRIPSIDRNDEGIKLLKGDRILMASDGVFGTLSQEQMEKALTRSVTEAAKIMGDLIREADKPYQDNNTLVILEYMG